MKKKEIKVEDFSQSQIEEHTELSIDAPDEDLVPKFGTEVKLAILNAPVVSTFGNYTYFPIPLESAKILVNAANISSYVGHKSTAEVLSEVLEKPVGFSRKMLRQKVGQMALVFKLKKRPEEGKILNKEEVEKHGYEFGILYRLR